MSDALDRASQILANAELLRCTKIVDGRTASNPHFLREEKLAIMHAMGDEIAKKLNPISERFISERDSRDYGPASVIYEADIVVMTHAQLQELTACIRKEQRRQEFTTMAVAS